MKQFSSLLWNCFAFLDRYVIWIQPCTSNRRSVSEENIGSMATWHRRQTSTDSRMAVESVAKGDTGLEAIAAGAATAVQAPVISHDFTGS